MPHTKHLELGEPKKPLCVCLTPSTINRLRSIASSRGISTSHMLELLLRDAFADKHQTGF